MVLIIALEVPGRYLATVRTHRKAIQCLLPIWPLYGRLAQCHVWPPKFNSDIIDRHQSSLRAANVLFRILKDWKNRTALEDYVAIVVFQPKKFKF